MKTLELVGKQNYGRPADSGFTVAPQAPEFKIQSTDLFG